MKIGPAVAAILRRSLSVDTRVITWEDVVNEDNSIPLRVIDSFDWSNDVEVTPDAVNWLKEGWKFQSRDGRTETVTFARDRAE